MNYGIGKIRPCGNSHLYKYAHATNINDMKSICSNYSSDIINDGEWTYKLDNIVNADSIFISNSYIKSANLYLPNCTSLVGMFRSSKIQNLTLDIPKASDLSTIVYHCSSLSSFSVLSNGEVHHGLTRLHYFAETTRNWLNITNLDTTKVIGINNAFCSNQGHLSGRTIEATFPKATTAIRAFSANVLEEIKYPIDEDNEWTLVTGKPQLVIDGVPQYKYAEFNSLSNGTAMFNMSRLNKPTILSIANSLPTWTSGTHNITIGCHIDHKYDPEVNLALKKLNMDYITPIEEAGGTLTEEVTSDKGWTTTIQWNGTATSNAYPAPTTTNEE